MTDLSMSMFATRQDYESAKRQTFGKRQSPPPMNWDSVARRYVEHDTLPQETFGDLAQDLRDGKVSINDVRRAAGLPPFPANDNTSRHGDFMQTYRGGVFHPLDARTAEVHIEDIAHSLSLQCRYAGHCLRFYSVAEHCVHIARWIWWHSIPMNALIGLMHDATEAYLVDMPRPVKRSLHEYRLHEAALWKVIAARYGLPEEMPEIVHEADNRIIADELVNMRPMAWHAKHSDPLGVRIEFWSPEEAEAAFLETFRMLTAYGAPASDDHYPQQDREASAADRDYQLAKEEAA